MIEYKVDLEIQQVRIKDRNRTIHREQKTITIPAEDRYDVYRYVRTVYGPARIAWIEEAKK